MSGEKLYVLRLLEQGKVTFEEALALLEALQGSDDTSEKEESLEEVSVVQVEDEWDAQDEDEDEDEEIEGVDVADAVQDALDEVGEELRSLGDEIREEIREALQEAGQEVQAAMQEVGEELRTAVGAGTGLAGLFGGSFGPQYNWQEEREIAVGDDVKSLDLAIKTKNGRVRLLPAAADSEQISVTIEYRLQAANEDEARAMAKQGLEETQVMRDGVLSLAFIANEAIKGTVSFTVYLPPELAAKLELTSKNGAISLQDVKGKGKLETKNGSIKVRGRCYEELEAETKNGSITIAASIGNLTASSKNGSVRASLEPLSENSEISLSTNNGSVRAALACDDEIGYSLDVETHRGGLKMELPGLVSQMQEKRRWRGTTQNWDTAKRKAQLTVQTRNGSISIRQQAADELN